MKLAYVIAPFRDGEAGPMGDNIAIAKDAARELWRMGLAVFCPHLNSGPLYGYIPEEVAITGNQVILLRCDLAVTLDGHHLSGGSRDELAICYQKHIPVYRWPEDQNRIREEAAK